MSENHPNEGASATETPTLPDSVHVLELEDRKVYLVGTAHVSPQSVRDVAATIEAVEPDTVCVELCEGRYRNLTDRESWQKLDIFQVLREGKAPLLLSSLVMSSFQRRIAEKFGVEPGAEMMKAIELARDNDLEIRLIDRDVQVTLRRTWAKLGFWGRMKMLMQLLASLFAEPELEEEDIEKLKEEGQLTDMLAALAEAFPTVKGTLIDERDLFLAEKLRTAGGERVVAVVGAGHVPGMLQAIGRPQELAPLEVVPPPSWVPRLLKWGIPIAVLALLAYGFFQGGTDQSIQSLGLWFLINGSLSALGAVIALGHPITVVSAFVAAPLTSLNPMVAAGWVAGLVQAWVRRPTVADLEGLPEATRSVGGFWKNPVSRVLLVVILANLGSTFGTFIAGGLIAANTL